MKGEKRNIEWSQLSWNWMSGCDGPEGDGVHCKGCYAKCIATMRLKGRYGYPKEDPFKVVLHKDKMDLPTRRKKPTVYFSVSMGDWMFAEPNWRKEALRIMKACPQHIFVTLTKQYDRLWAVVHDSPETTRGVEIPRNVIVGISVTKREQVRGIDMLRIMPTFTKLVCFEPLLEDVSDIVDLTGINWIIIGKRTRQGRTSEFMPEKEWVDKLIAKARELDIPVFLKPSMTATVGWKQIQETPYEGIRRVMGPRPQTMDGLIQKHVRNIPPPPRGRMCGSDGIY